MSPIELVLLLSATFLIADSYATPNFIVILADDFGWGDPQVFGHPTTSTPRLNRMAAEGVRFTQMYTAAPLCSPSRAALLTGRLPVRNGAYRNDSALGYSLGVDAVFADDSVGGLSLDEVTIADALRSQKGYKTKMIGKWHLGQRPQYLPTSRGFDEAYFSAFTHGEAFTYNGTTARCPLMHNTTILGRLAVDHAAISPGAKTQKAQHTYIPFDWLTPMYTSEALKFIEENRANPFFLYYAPDCTHLPVYSSNAFKNSSIRGEYGDAAAEMDWSIGQIMDKLKEMNLETNTMVFFASDNGPALYESLKNRTGIKTPVRKDDVGSAGLLRGGKATTWDGGFRTPGIAWWPGTIKPNQVSMQVSSLMDIYPTIMDLAGAKVEQDRIYDGLSLANLMTGATDETSINRTLFLYRGDTMFAARRNEYKAHYLTWGEISVSVPPLTRYDGTPCPDYQRENCHCTVASSQPLLYHLEHDPSEAYPISEKSVEYETVMKAIDEDVKAHKAKLVPAKAEMNMCDPHFALWGSDLPVPASKVGWCSARPGC
ncbi:N-acetylgalactosamine-6-sulfatase-like isoform X2 [Oscarella lobularis]|uniref:N-acetylgalactosamine-6-sulfatase-like isoform X2 n=1 Tax=Oscarella lobularis TaxID=121494 RepID=UPI003313E92E